MQHRLVSLSLLLSVVHAFRSNNPPSLFFLSSARRAIARTPQITTRRHISASSRLSGAASSSLSNEEISRYSRHLVLSTVGVKGQEAFKEASVLVIGAGGLGSPCLLYLAAAGVGHIGIVDADTVDASNLQRQIVHATSTVGKTKCESAAERLKDLNPHVHIRLYEEELTSATAMRIVGEGFSENKPYDVVVDGSDNFPTKYLINDVCHLCGIPWVYSAILAFEGQLSVFNYPPRTGPDYRDLLPVPPPPGDVPSCAEGGVLGVLPGTMGCLQATEVLKLLLVESSSKVDASGLLCGRVLVFDALPMKFHEIHLARSVDREPISELIDYQGFCGAPQTPPTPPQRQQPQASSTGGRRASSSTTSTTSTTTTTTVARTMDEAEIEPAAVATATLTAVAAAEKMSDGDLFQSISPKACLEKLQNGWSPWVLDVRLHAEHDIVALPFTDRVVPHRSVSWRRDIPKEGDVLVYCKGGVRGKKACTQLIQQGVDPKRLYNLQGGILLWQKEVDPSMPRY